LEGPCGHYVKKLLKQKGLVLKGYDKVKMPDNYIVAFSAPTQEEIEKLLKAGHLKAEKIGQAILKGEKFYHSGHFAYLLTSYENSSFVKYAVSPQEFSVNEDCIKCGKCAANCPMNNISLSDQGPKWGNKCCLCLACLNLCPKRAIDYGKKTKKRGRYVNPNYRAD
jgi:ferredoxin